MSSLQANLSPGERITYIGSIHPIIYYGPGVVFVISLLMFVVAASFSIENDGGKTAANFIGGLLLFISLVGLLRAYIISRTSEYLITNKRLYLKVGFLNKRAIETYLNKIASLEVSQSIFGSMLGYGSLRSTGTGSTTESFPFCADPMAFRKALNAQVEALKNEEVQKMQAAPIPAGSSPSEGMKICPACAESIKAAAAKCRYCGEQLLKAV